MGTAPGPDDPWVRVRDLRPEGPDRWRATATVEPDSPWFTGHFPGDPILPGIAQLALVHAVVGTVVPGGASITGLRRVRFKQVLRPPMALAIRIRREAGGNGPFWAFQIECDGGVACTGSMTAEPRMER